MISLRNVSKSYRDVRALNDFTYDFDDGIYAILGPNGSGKSTLMNIITGNISKDKGEFLFHKKSGTHDLLQDNMIGYVPQYPGMYPNFTVYDMLQYASVLNGLKNNDEQIDELITAFELNEYASKKIRSLSGGTRQRLAIAQAFIGSPKLVVLDEPTAGLDPLQRILFKNYISKKSSEMTIIISTHIVSDVENISDNVIFLKKGEIVLSGEIKDVICRLQGKCWRISETNHIEQFPLARVSGDEIRIIADEIPCEDAVLVEPTLDDCYLYIFGLEQ